MIACWLLAGLVLASEGVTPIGVAVTYPAGKFYEVAAHPERKVRHLIVPLGDGYYRIKGGRTVAGFMAQSNSNYWPGIRYMDVQVWDPARRRWSPRLTVAILDISKREHLEQHRRAARVVPGLGKVKGMLAEFNYELACRFNFWRDGGTAVRILRGQYR